MSSKKPPKLPEKLHTHPELEAKLGLDKDHVIIDRTMYDKLKKEELEDAYISGTKVVMALVARGTEKDWAGMPVVMVVKKPEGGMINYLRYDAVIKEVNKYNKIP